MSIETITSKITEDARQQAESVMGEAQVKADAIRKDAETRAEEIRDAAEKRGALEKEKILSQRKSVADMDSRRMILTEKQTILDDCFSKALQHILDLPEQEYTRFLLQIVQGTGLTSGEIIMNPADKAKYGGAFAALLAREIPGSSFRIAEETRKFAGGLMVKDGNVYINGTIESYAQEARSSMARELSDVLFG